MKNQAQTIKIAHIATTYQSIVTILHTKLRLLNEYGNLEIKAISSSPLIKTSRKPTVRHITVEIARSIKPFSDIKSIWALYKILKNKNFDIVHSHTAKAGMITAIAARMARIPLVCHTYHGLPFFEGQNKIKYFIYKFLEQVACRFRNYAFTQNTRDLNQTIKLMSRPERVFVEGNGVDIEHINKTAPSQLRSALGDYPCEGLRLVLLSRFEPVKRVDNFVRVVEKLKQSNLKISCVVAGTGILEGYLHKLVSEMHLQDCINIVGFSDRPLGLIAASDILVLCSEKEGLPRSIMEAMALQKPVVATDVSGTREIVVDGETGFLTDFDDIAAMAEKIIILLKNSELRKAMGAHGLKRIIEHYSETKIVEKLYKFYCSKIPVCQ